MAVHEPRDSSLVPAPEGEVSVPALHQAVSGLVAEFSGRLRIAGHVCETSEPLARAGRRFTMLVVEDDYGVTTGPVADPLHLGVLRLRRNRGYEASPTRRISIEPIRWAIQRPGARRGGGG